MLTLVEVQPGSNVIKNFCIFRNLQMGELSSNIRPWQFFPMPLALLANIKLGWKSLPVTSTLAFLAHF
jgi:hypothetical protein